MRTSAFVLLFLLVFSLSASPGTAAETAVPTLADTEQQSECFSIMSENSDCFATETVQTAVPSPIRALRSKQHERQQRTGYDGSDGYSVQHFPRAGQCRTQSFISALIRGRQSAMPAHDSDYLKFGILVI